MGLKAAIQALKKAEKLKEKLQNSKDLLNDSEAWICQQQLQRIYQQVLILDLEFALDRKVEQDLWNHGFKNYISTLQNLVKDKKNTKRIETQAMLSWCLESASGFYLTLLQEICTAFDLDLPFRRKGSVFGNRNFWRNVEHLNQPHKNSCYYICQYCLVHLGDIARYRCQSRQAEAFYRHAVQLAPNSGQPYNQLALLEASRGDKLSTVFHYVRSVAVRHPFPAAATNLAKTLNKCAEEQIPEGRFNLSLTEYISVFLKLHGLIHITSDIPLSEKCVNLLNNSLTVHIASDNISSWKLIQMLAINLFALHNNFGNSEVDKRNFSEDHLSNNERKIRHLMVEVLAGALHALLLPVYTIKDSEALLDFAALPAIKLIFDWIMLNSKVLSTQPFMSRPQIWSSLCKLLNGLQPFIADFSADKFTFVPLPEDRDLQGFLPLEKSFHNVRFSCQDWKIDSASLYKLRAFRLINIGTWLAKQENLNLITCKNSADQKDPLFEPVGMPQALANDLIHELEELSLAKLPSPAPSEASSWSSSITGNSTPDQGLLSMNIGHSSPPPVDNIEKCLGLLKSQISQEALKVKDEEASWSMNSNNTNLLTIGKKGRQNVAMQAIMRKSNTSVEPDNTKDLEKQVKVTFKTPSPQASPENSADTPKSGALSDLPKDSVWNNSPKLESICSTFTSKQNVPEYLGNSKLHGDFDQSLAFENHSQYNPWKENSLSWWHSGNGTEYQSLHNLLKLPLSGEPTISDCWSTENESKASVDPSFSSLNISKTKLQGESDSKPDDKTFFSSLGNSAFATSGGSNTYSLFSNSGWPSSESNIGTSNIGFPNLFQQSLWSGPGPSPLERLLEQQKQLREGPSPKGGT